MSREEQQYHIREFSIVSEAEEWLNEEFQNGYRLAFGPIKGAGLYILLVTERLPKKGRPPRSKEEKG